MMIITLLFTYNSRITTRYLEQNMTLCECLRRCTGICDESRVTCMKNYEWWLCHKIRCQLHDHAKQYDNDEACHITLHDHVVDIVFVAKPPFIILSYMSLLIHCISRYTAGGIHIESYFVLSIEL